jgi:hypothetical protein
MSVFTPHTESTAFADWMRIMRVALLGTLLALVIIATIVFTDIW